jgi:hypothetical protein
VEAGGIDIRLIPMPYILARGAVTGMPLSPGNVQVRFTPDGETQPLETEVKNGKFSMWLIPPGKYSMMVACQGRDGRAYSSAIDEIAIGDEGSGNLALDMRPEFELAGRIQWEGSPPPPRERQPKPSVRLNDIASQTIAPRRIGEIGDDQAFRIPKVLPGKYGVSIGGLPQNVWVKSILVDSHEIPGHTLELRTAPQEITVRLATGGAQISGTVEDATGPVSGVTVILAPDEAGFGEFNALVRQTSDSGAFSFDSIPPGRYRLEVDGARPSDGQPFETLEVSETDRLTRNLKIEHGMK